MVVLGRHYGTEVTCPDGEVIKVVESHYPAEYGFFQIEKLASGWLGISKRLLLSKEDYDKMVLTDESLL